jgi:hypothetical protein
MKVILEHLHNAIRLEHRAASEQNDDVKATLKKQAALYRQLAQERSRELGIPLPAEPQTPED